MPTLTNYLVSLIKHNYAIMHVKEYLLIQNNKFELSSLRKKSVKLIIRYSFHSFIFGHLIITDIFKYLSTLKYFSFLKIFFPLIYPHNPSHFPQYTWYITLPYFSHMNALSLLLSQFSCLSDLSCPHSLLKYSIFMTSLNLCPCSWFTFSSFF